MLHRPFFVTIDKSWCNSSDVGATTNHEKNHKKQRFEVEKC